MNNILEYKGYHAKIEFDAETFSVRGKIEGINDLVDFESDKLENIETEFHVAVDDYLAFCEEVGKEPDKEYKGTFNVRVAPELHRAAAILAMRKGISLNCAVEQAIKEYLVDEDQAKHALKNSIDMLTRTIRTETSYRYSQTQSTEKSKVVHFPESRIDYKYNARMVGES